MENVARFEGQRRSRFGRGTIVLVALAVVVVVWALNVKDWHQLWTIVSAPDNIPIAALLIVVPFFTWLGLRQSRDNDELIEQLEADPDDEPVESAVVLPRPPGDARLLRPLDRGRRHAGPAHRRPDGLPVCGLEPFEARPPPEPLVFPLVRGPQALADAPGPVSEQASGADEPLAVHDVPVLRHLGSVPVPDKTSAAASVHHHLILGHPLVKRL